MRSLCLGAELVTATPKADSLDRPPLPVAEPELPGGQVDLASAFYVKRHPVEERCFEAIALWRESAIAPNSKFVLTEH